MATDDPAAVPTAELHVHLNGAIPARTLLELGRRHRVPMPADSVQGLREAFRFRDFDHFQHCFDAYITPCLRDGESLELAAYEFFGDLAAEGVRYAEVMVTPWRYRNAMPEEVYLAALRNARARAREELGLEVWWIFEISRDVLGEREPAYWADYTLETAIGNQHDGVVALGLSGAEAGHPPEPFSVWFERARAAGLRSAPHAGEHAGAASVRGAVDALYAERIPHGVRAVEDPALVRELAERGIVLDTCPTSNLCLGVVDSLPSHPLPHLHRAGVAVTLNTDDPTLFGNTLGGEICNLRQVFGMSEEEVGEIVGNAMRFGFKSAAAEARFR